MTTEKELIPQFETEEQEAKYWDTHSPLDVSAEPEAQRVRTKVPKDRPITIRLDRESRRKLEELAAERKLGPSTFARHILMSAIAQGGKPPRSLSLDELMDRLEQSLTPQTKERLESLINAISIGNPPLLPELSQQKVLAEVTLLLFRALLAIAGAQVVSTPNSREKEAQSATR